MAGRSQDFSPPHLSDLQAPAHRDWHQPSFDFQGDAGDDAARRTSPVADHRPRPRQPSLFDWATPAVERERSTNPLDTPLFDSESGRAATEGSGRTSPGSDRSVTTIASGVTGKAHDLLSAIEVLKIVEGEGRAPIADERRQLLRFAGFGAVALSIFPDPAHGTYKNARWRALGERLAALLTPREYDDAKRTTFNAFYTSPAVVGALHRALGRLGVDPAARVLEPGCGIGRFFEAAPPTMRFTGIELDGVSGRIARLLHPTHDIRIEDFGDSRFPEGFFDAALGNVPFSDLKRTYRGDKFSLHDFFLVKALDLVKAGGVLAFVTSHFTLDKRNAAVRERIAATADLVGAIRLPCEAFQREGTAVVTDLVFLRKRFAGAEPEHCDASWLELTTVDVEGQAIPLNKYFVDHPEMVLGTFSTRNTLYGAGLRVVGASDWQDALGRAIERLPQLAFVPTAHPPARADGRAARPPPAAERAEGSLDVVEGRICQWTAGALLPVVYGGGPLRVDRSLIAQRLAALIDLRDRARTVLQSQNDGWPESERGHARQELNDAYDRFARRFGPINKTTVTTARNGTVIRRMPNLVKFRDDPDAMLVLALEHYDEPSGQAAKAAIFNEDVVGKAPEVTQVASAQEGLLVSLDRKGLVDLELIETLYGQPPSLIVRELGDLIYFDPETQVWQTADQYLSGNVRHKLRAALAAGPEFARNQNALAEVQPEDVLPGDIDAKLGAPWVPAADVQAFAAELFQVEPDYVPVAHLPSEAVWNVAATFAARASVAATSEFGTSRANGTWLLELALNLGAPSIYDTVVHEGREERVLNREATQAASEKQKLIKEQFRRWVFRDQERTERLVRLYNDAFNNLRPRRRDGRHLEFPGMNRTVRLRPHQVDAVWRIMSSGNTLLAHVVGAGKTFTMAAAGMKLKQAGLVHKPMYVVPNHLLEQFARELLQLYPNAKLLIAAKEDLGRERRKLLTAQIVSGRWDGIVVTHSSFERIGMSHAFQETFLRRQVAEYDRLLCEFAADRGTPRNLLKTIEKLKAARLERLKDLAAREKKDDGLVFDELGIDHLFIDEAQSFKNLETPTKMERVAGIQTSGSERAFDLFMKACFLHEQRPGRGLTFATGTPVSNTMVELYTMQRYLDPEGLRQRGIEHFDAWAGTFGEVVEIMEIAPDGASLRPRSRFARFANLPELQQMFRAFADVQTAASLDLPRPRLKTGKAIVVACPMSAAQERLQQHLVERYERLRSQRIDPRQDNALAITTDGRKLATDARLLAADAGDAAESKIHALAQNVAEIWRQSRAQRGTQLIFADLGVHPTPWGFSVYEDVIAKLENAGVPAREIATVGEADSDAKKQALFERVRQGTIRILLGSTQKMGTGTNVQKRLVALHHLDAPWKPAEVEQREGRILRQGNDHEEVTIYRYVTERSFDAYIWQALETKARFIGQVITGTNALRCAEDIGGQELSFAEVKAIASGNPGVLTLAECDAELQRLAILRKSHLDEQFVARRSVRELPGRIENMTEELARRRADLATLEAHRGDPLTIDGVAYERADAIAVLGQRLERVPAAGPARRRVELGVFRGLRFGLTIDPRLPPAVYLHGHGVRESDLLRDHQGARAVVNALDRLASAYDSDCRRLHEDLCVAEGQLRDYRRRVGVPFAQEQFVCALTELRDALRTALSETTPESAGPSARELVERIELLRRGHGAETGSAPEAGCSRPAGHASVGS
jgi:N12 class adenine-specific DNA methylase